MAIKLLGVKIESFPASKNPHKENATLVALYALEDVDVEKYRRIAIGQTSESPFNKDPIPINANYAHKLISTGAFVSDQDYELQFKFNEQEMTNECCGLMPVDPELRKHFETCMK